MRRRRLIRGILLAAVLTAGATMVFGSVAMGNELALRDRVAASSRFGPTDVDGDPPLCDGAMGIGPSARIGVEIDGTLDGRSMGSITLGGDRSRADIRWLAYVATSRELGIHGAAVIGPDTWIRDPFSAWRRSTPSEIGDADLDITAFRIALSPEARAAAGTQGVGVIEGARARECRVLIDGPTFRAAFPQVSWLVGAADLAHWRGELDYWVFLDGQIGRVAGSVNGDAADIQPGALQATIRVDLTATDRGASLPIVPPTP